MFENLRDAFREAIANFRQELGRDQVPASVDRLLAGMHDEITDAKVRVRELEDMAARAEAEAARERRDADTATRRGTMAREIGDAETAEVAEQFARKHQERVRLVEQKAAALREELAFRRKEIDEMLEKFKDARAKRDSLAATAGRSGTRDSIGAADDLFAELDRMAEKIGDEDARAQAAERFADLDLDLDADASPPPPPRVDFDARLEELKRRMDQE